MPGDDHIIINKIKFLLDNPPARAMIDDFVYNSKLCRIFSIFDKDGNGNLEMQNLNGENEILNIWNTMQEYASRNGDTTFDSNEVYEFLLDSKINENASTNEWIGVGDVYQFVANMFRKDPESYSNIPPADLLQEISLDELQDLSVISLSEDVEKARDLFDVQVESQGAISDFVNFCKEIWDSEYAASRVDRYIMREEYSNRSLVRALSDEGLSKKDYLEGKIDLLISMLPKLKESSALCPIIKNALCSLGGLVFYPFAWGKDRSGQELSEEELEIDMLRDALRHLTPEQLINLTDRVSGLSEDEYDEQATQILETLLQPGVEKIERFRVLGQVDHYNETETPGGFVEFRDEFAPGTIGALEATSLADERISFEETFFLERGTVYDAAAMADYQTKYAEMQVILAYNNQLNEVDEKLRVPLGRVAEGDAYVGDIDYLRQTLGFVFCSIYGNDAQKIQAKINELMGTDKFYNVLTTGDNGRDFFILDPRYFGADDLVELAQRLQSHLNDNYQILLNGKSFDEHAEELRSAYSRAYGEKSAQRAADAFAESQAKGVQTVKTVANTVGTVVVVAGMCIPGGQGVSAALVWGGTAISALSGATISTIEAATKSGGLTDEDKQMILTELSTSIALTFLGRGIGKVSGATFKTLILNNCPRFLAWIAEVGVDAGLSLLSTYVITGELDLRGEGLAQLQQVLVGILGVKARSAKGGLRGGFRGYLDNKVNAALSTLNTNNVNNVRARTNDMNQFIRSRNNIVNYEFNNHNRRNVSNRADGEILYVDNANDGAYHLRYDGQGEVFGYAHETGDGLKYYLYDNAGQPHEVRKNVFDSRVNQVHSSRQYRNNARAIQYLFERKRSGNCYIDIQEFAKYNDSEVPRFGEYTLNKLNNLVRSEEDAQILTHLMKSVGSNGRYEYGTDDILRIMNSPEAKGYIKNNLAANIRVTRDDIKAFDEHLLFEPETHSLSDNRDLSHIIPDFIIGRNGENGQQMSPREVQHLFKTDSRLRDRIPPGEVANINGILYVNDGDGLVRLNLSKAKFEQLFPIELRHKLYQGSLGDCWLVSSMAGIMDTPKGRARVYSMFSETNDGRDIVIKFPNTADNEVIRFRDGELNELSAHSLYIGRNNNNQRRLKIGSQYDHVFASKGIQMLEQAYSIHRNDGYSSANISDSDIQSIFFMNNQMHRLAGGWQSEAVNNILGRENVVYHGWYNTRGNDSETIWHVRQYLNSDPNTMVYFATKHGFESVLGLDIVEGHACRVVGLDEAKGTITISNPHHNNNTREIPIADWLNYVESVNAFEIL